MTERTPHCGKDFRKFPAASPENPGGSGQCVLGGREYSRGKRQETAAINDRKNASLRQGLQEVSCGFPREPRPVRTMTSRGKTMFSGETAGNCWRVSPHGMSERTPHCGYDFR